MTPEFKALLEEWLCSGNDVQKRHAAARLAIGDNPPPPPTLPPLPDNPTPAPGVRLGGCCG